MNLHIIVKVHILCVYLQSLQIKYILFTCYGKKEHFSVYSCDYEALDISREIDKATSLFEM